MIRASLLLNGAGLALALLIAGGTAMAAPGPNGNGGPTPTTTTISFVPPKVQPGQTATVTGTVVVTATGAAVAVGKITIQEYVDANGNGIPCGTPGGVYVNLNPGGTAVNASGQVSVSFTYPNPATSLMIGFRAHYVPNGAQGSFGQSMSACADLLDPPATCTADEGVVCAGLSKGAYGNAGSVANCNTAGCNPWNNSAPLAFDGKGFIPSVDAVDAFGNPVPNGVPDVFDGDPNATTIGRHDIPISVTIDDQATLLSALPGGGEPAPFNPLWVAGDVHYPSVGPISHFVGRSKTWNGDGAGNLAEQAMTAKLNRFLSGKTGGLQPGGFGGFTVDALTEDTNGDFVADRIALLCTKKTSKKYSPPGVDTIPGNADDVVTTTSCQASRYPACVAGKTVSQVLAAADSFLAGATVTDTQLVNCTASDLSTALDLFNTQFDEQGEVIACPAGVVDVVDHLGAVIGDDVLLNTYLASPGKAEFVPCP